MKHDKAVANENCNGKDRITPCNIKPKNNDGKLNVQHSSGTRMSKLKSRDLEIEMSQNIETH